MAFSRGCASGADAGSTTPFHFTSNPPTGTWHRPRRASRDGEGGGELPVAPHLSGDLEEQVDVVVDHLKEALGR